MLALVALPGFDVDLAAFQLRDPCQGGVALLLHSIEHFCPTGDAGCMLRDSHQFIVCIERTALAEDDRIRMHDARHYLRPLRLGLRRGGLRHTE
ncbi:hypothetical protein APB02_32195 [Pseudomonas aeruginosa]|nr:hypothetical protein APB02_32195 [Pseudomonas aeruginosa]